MGTAFSQCNLTGRTGLMPQPHITRVPELQGAQPVGDQLSSDPKMWPAAREEARPSLGGSHCLMGVQEHRGCGLGGWEGISGAQPEHPR